jgi:glycosyltransferase involved in cell wall biosynthesis
MKFFKIAVVSSGNIPSQLANSINTVKHAHAFKKMGHTVEIFSPLRSIESKFKSRISSFSDHYGISPDIKINLVHDRMFYLNNFKWVKFLDKLSIKYLFNLRIHFDVEKKIAQKIIDLKFNVAYCRTFRVPYYLIKNKIPVILEMHTPTPEKLGKEFKSLISASKSDYFLCLSTIHQKLKQKYADLGIPAEKILVQEDAVDLEMFDRISLDKTALRKKLGLPDKKIITYSGSLYPSKGLDNLLKIISHFDNQKVFFLIIGGPEYLKKHYEQNSFNNGVTNILFTGFVPNSQIPYYLKASDILIMLYTNYSKKNVMDLTTTSPIKLFEYMASKIPIIATSIPTITKIVENRKEALLVPPDNNHQTILAINELICNGAFSDKLSRNAYLRVKKYTYVERCKHLLETFK